MWVHVESGKRTKVLYKMRQVSETLNQLSVLLLLYSLSFEWEQMLVLILKMNTHLNSKVVIKEIELFQGNFIYLSIYLFIYLFIYLCTVSAIVYVTDSRQPLKVSSVQWDLRQNSSCQLVFQHFQASWPMMVCPIVPFLYPI